MGARRGERPTILALAATVIRCARSTPSVRQKRSSALVAYVTHVYHQTWVNWGSSLKSPCSFFWQRHSSVAGHAKAARRSTAERLTVAAERCGYRAWATSNLADNAVSLRR